MMDEQNRFITDASHELRTPLTSLKSEIEVSLRDKKLTFDETKKLLESNLEEVNNLQVLSDKLIKLTQYQKGENGFLITQNSSREILNEAVKRVAKPAKLKKITITNNVKDYLIGGDYQALVEMFVVFLDNAIKYSPKNSQVMLIGKKTDGRLQIQIKDQGIGIHAQDIPHLFDRFYRADKSRAKTEVAGYGLGFSIAKQIIDRHGGSVNIKSEVSRGSVFTIELPAKHPQIFFPK